MFIVRSIEKVYAYPSGKVFENQNDGRRAFERSEAEEAVLQDILIYSEADFRECYVRHVEGEPHGNRSDETYSVLRRVGARQPIKMDAFRNILHNGLLANRIISNKLEIQFKKEFAAYLFRDGTCLNWENPRPAKLCCRDIKNITVAQLPVIARQFLMNEQEKKEVIQYISASFAKASGYRVRCLFAIGHSDIRAA